MKRRRLRQSTYLPEQAIDEMRSEAARLGRSISYVARLAWRIARERVRLLGPEMQR